MSLASLSASCRSFRPSRSQIGPMGSLILRNNQPLVQEAAKKLCFSKTRYDESPENEWIFGSERDNTSWLRMLHRLETVERLKKIDFAANLYFMVYKSVDGSMKKINVKDSRNEPVDVPCDADIVQVACGYSHFLLLGSKGEVFSFGSNLDGECGLDANTPFITMPTIIPALVPHKVVAVSAGDFASAVVTDDGKLITFGESKCFGHGGEIYATPTVVSSLDGYFVELVAMYAYQTIVAARDEGGRQHLFGFGVAHVELKLFCDKRGRNIKVPTLIPFFENNKFEIVQLSTSNFQSMALSLSEQVIIWGLTPTVVVTLNYCTFSLSSFFGTFAGIDKGETYSISYHGEKREISILKGLHIEHFCLDQNAHSIFVRTLDGQILKLDSSGEDQKLSKIVFLMKWQGTKEMLLLFNLSHVVQWALNRRVY